MQSRWNDAEAQTLGDAPLALRVYTSRLLGQEPSLVLHGGGNTSVKATVRDLFGDESDVLYVKGSGWDLETIQEAGFAPVKLDVLRKMAELESLSDADMVKHQRAAMTDPGAPNPSVEAILHAIIPARFVDHTHADAVVTISNTADGAERIRRLYGERVLIVPYVMPGFILAKKINESTRGIDWDALDGIILLNHGVFTWGETAQQSYGRMIALVSEAEDYLAAQGAGAELDPVAQEPVDLQGIARVRAAISHARGAPVVMRLDGREQARAFSRRSDLAEITSRGPLTPDHIIRTKRTPLLVRDADGSEVAAFAEDYRAYFARNESDGLTCLDPAPRWAVWPGFGTLAFGCSTKEAGIIADITRHTRQAMVRAEHLGGWRVASEKDLFEIEYWELEQAKLAKAKAALPLQGKIALVTGAASGIGRACVDVLREQGAAVVALDVDSAVEALTDDNVLALVCDVTDDEAVRSAVTACVLGFGGLDILVSNAGFFPGGQPIAEMTPDAWSRSLELNLSSHQRLLTRTIPFLREGIDPAVILMASKNVPAPGPGASAYSVAKAGLTQLARVAALELAGDGIRVNVLHPNAVFDTGIWTDDVLAARAEHYGMSVEEYKTSNLLKVNITSRDVADLVCAMAGPLFSKTTGAQVPIDGGDPRVI